MDYAHADIVDTACINVGLSHADVDSDGLVTVSSVCERAAAAMKQLAAL
jgi:hypothetical protein